MKLFRKGIRQRRLTRMRELLKEVMIENDSENELPQDGKSARVLVLLVEIIIITGLLTHPNVLESGEAFMLMGLIFPPFLLFWDFTRNGYFTPHYRGHLFVSLFQGRGQLSRV